MIPWSPLHGGLLGGVLGNDATARRRRPRARRGRSSSTRPQIERWEEFCAELGEDPADVALAWLLHQPARHRPIIGPRTMAQLDGASLRALDLRSTTRRWRRLDEIFPGPGGAAPEAYAW